MLNKNNGKDLVDFSQKHVLKYFRLVTFSKSPSKVLDFRTWLIQYLTIILFVKHNNDLSYDEK